MPNKMSAEYIVGCTYEKCVYIMYKKREMKPNPNEQKVSSIKKKIKTV